jgi:glycosyltransferase involved in cell wall biosynthesis
MAHPVGPAATGARPRIGLVIPTLDEEAAILQVLAAVPREFVDEIIVADSGSTDRTVARALAAGVRVVSETRRGYGRACATGAAAAQACEIIVFLDGDGSDCPELIPQLVLPILDGQFDFVIGSRTRGPRETGSMTPHQVLAGYLAGFVLRLLYPVRYTDMCPFRAIRRDALARLPMRETTYGWNLEMQMRAARAGLRILEIPVAHRRRAGGRSKVSGTLRGTVKASWRLVLTLARIACERGGASAPPGDPLGPEVRR